ncbi:response regulator transcription factor [Parasutterella muris]|uniref:Response regulator n=1 Tax=Parasutterella muris TaxID=2565572 RepID=A0A6L6YH19_9BURK|nr:response regulator [Parasutterella muris]MVX56897.1 response regulator [Parasutterella muris]
MKLLTPIIRIVDDDKTVSDSLSFFLNLAGLQTRSFSSAEDFLRSDDPERLGCLILDVRMEGMTGIELQAELKRVGSDLPIIFLSAHGDIEMAVSCVENGAFNFLVKPPDPDKLLDLVSKAVAKNKQVRREKAYAESLREQFETLTAAEKKVSYQIAKGLPNSRIAEILEISERTVQSHRANIFAKLDLENPVELNEFLREMQNS